MAAFLDRIGALTAETLLNVAPVVLILFVFQAAVIRRRPPRLARVLAGFGYVLVGLTLFLFGLDQALFPLGKTMARQLTDPALLPALTSAGRGALDYIWVYVFAAALGFATTVAEPALIAVASKAEDLSGGTIGAWSLRVAVAVGVAFGVSLGTYRIVSGTPLPYYILAGYLVVIFQTWRSSRWIIPLAYDSGGVTTSTVTVPVVAALGLGLAGTIPGRSPLIDGFGLIAFASLFPIISVLGYAMLVERLQRRRETPRQAKDKP